MRDVSRMFMREKECMRETGSPRGKQEVQEGDRKCRGETGSAGGTQEVQEGDKKCSRETGSGANWKGSSEGTRSVPEPDSVRGIRNRVAQQAGGQAEDI